MTEKSGKSRNHPRHEPIASERLAPLEETCAKEDGSMIVESGKLKAPQGFVDDEDGNGKTLGLEPIVLILLVFGVGFIALISYLIYITPNTGK